MPAAKKTVPRKRPAPTKKSATASVLDKMSLFKTFTNYGLGGCVVGYMLIFTVPEIQKSFTATIEKRDEQSREDRKAAFEHGEKAVERIASSIDGLKASWSTVQGVTQGNQRALIEEQKKTNELLETKIGVNDFNPTLR